MSFFAAIAALLNAIPIFDKWFQQFMAWYIVQKVAAMDAETVTAIKNAIAKHDQTQIETVLQSNLAGKPTGDGGAVIVDSLPGISQLPKP